MQIRNSFAEMQQGTSARVRGRVADYYNGEPVDLARLASTLGIGEHAFKGFLYGENELDLPVLFKISDYLSKRNY